MKRATVITGNFEFCFGPARPGEHPRLLHRSLNSVDERANLWESVPTVNIPSVHASLDAKEPDWRKKIGHPENPPRKPVQTFDDYASNPPRKPPERPDERLDEGAATFRERNAIYGDTFEDVGRTCKALFPNGVTLKTESDFARFHILCWNIGKAQRYCANFEKGGHKDSAHDSMVYWAIQQYLDEKAK